MSPARPRPLTDTERILSAVRDINGRLDELSDEVIRGNARTDEAVRNIAEVRAQQETVAADLDATSRRATHTREEILATVRNGYRQLDERVTTEVAEMREKVEKITSSLAASLPADLHATAQEAAQAATARTGRHIRRGVLPASLVAAGGAVVVIVKNAPAAAHLLHAFVTALPDFIAKFDKALG